MGNNLRDRVQNNAVARQGNTGQGGGIAGFIRQLTPEIERALPKHMSGDRMARLLLTAVRQTPKLANCDPQSFAGAVLTASILGLEPNTPSGEAYLIPYGRECTLVIGYQGMTKLFYQHPMAQHIDAQAVREGDDFDYAYGIGQYLRHRPALRDRGDVIAYYAVAEMKGGASAFVVLSPEEVKALRQGKEGPSGKIADPMKWMERKTALRQLLKMLPKSTDLSYAMAADEQNGSILRQAVRDGNDIAALEAAPAVHDYVDADTGEVHDSRVIDTEEPPADGPDLWAKEDQESNQ